jgi:hypothetical protein
LLPLTAHQVPPLRALLLREALTPVSVLKAIDLVLLGVDGGPAGMLLVRI